MVGGLFNVLGFVDSFGNFIGSNAVAAYGGAVPLEDSAAVGTRARIGMKLFAPNGQQISNELMTGFFVPGEVTLLSDTTIGAFADLGYTVTDPSVGTWLVVDSHLLMA